MANARFKVSGRFDYAARLQAGTVTIYRSTGVVSVRPHRRRRQYSLPLGIVAEMIVQRIIKAELAAKRAKHQVRVAS